MSRYSEYLDILVYAPLTLIAFVSCELLLLWWFKTNFVVQQTYQTVQPIRNGSDLVCCFLTGEEIVRADADDDRNYSLLKDLDALKNIDDEAVNRTAYQSSDDRSIKKCRTYEQLRKIFMARLEKTNAEILNQLFEKFDEEYWQTGEVCSHEDPESETFFEILEDLLHRKDDADEFLRRDGIRKIMRPCLLSNSTSMRTLSARVLGAAVRSSLRVQTAALEAGLMTPLMKSILFEKNYETRASSLFALSCLLRSFPLAQTHFIVKGGLDLLLHLFDGTSAHLRKLQMKVVILFYDLISEKEEVERSFTTLNWEKDAEQSFKEIDLMLNTFLWKEGEELGIVDLKTNLKKRGWCARLRAMLIATIPDMEFGLTPDVQECAVDYDLMNKFPRATMSFASECQKEFLNEDKSSKKTL